MYNKLFSKILDSSIWLAPDPHRIVWFTFLAAMDEDGNAMFASAGNLAARARVTREQAEDAIRAFESPDPDSGDPEFDGRRIERFPGGWYVLNAAKYRAMVTKVIIREQTRIRTAKYRAEKRMCDAQVTHVTQGERTSDDVVTPSVSVSVAFKTPMPPADAEGGPAPKVKVQKRFEEGFPEFWATYPRRTAKAAAEKAWAKAKPDATLQAVILKALSIQGSTPAWIKDEGAYVPHAATWLNGQRWLDEVGATAAELAYGSNI